MFRLCTRVLALAALTGCGPECFPPANPPGSEYEATPRGPDAAPGPRAVADAGQGPSRGGGTGRHDIFVRVEAHEIPEAKLPELMDEARECGAWSVSGIEIVELSADDDDPDVWLRCRTHVIPEAQLVSLTEPQVHPGHTETRTHYETRSRTRLETGQRVRHRTASDPADGLRALTGLPATSPARRPPRRRCTRRNTTIFRGRHDGFRGREREPSTAPATSARVARARSGSRPPKRATCVGP